MIIEWAPCLSSSSSPAARTLLCGLDADEAAGAAFVFELDDAGDLGEKRVVLADADVHAGLKLCAALAHENGSAADQLAAEPLHTQTLRITVPAVSRAADAFFMSHE